jgi:CBS domain-containing protein
MKQVDFVAVTNEKTCVGILTDDEIIAHLSDPGFDPSITTARDLIREQDHAAIVEDRDLVRKISQNAAVEDAFQMMADHDLKYLAVHDDDGVLVGVLSRSEVPDTSASLRG